jgi:hypothetical protein
MLSRVIMKRLGCIPVICRVTASIAVTDGWNPIRACIWGFRKTNLWWYPSTQKRVLSVSPSDVQCVREPAFLVQSLSVHLLPLIAYEAVWELRDLRSWSTEYCCFDSNRMDKRVLSPPKPQGSASYSVGKMGIYLEGKTTGTWPSPFTSR